MSIWDHNWLGDGSFISKPTDLYHELEDLTVADLMIENTRLWDVGFIRSLVNAEDAAKILKTLNLESIHHDKLSWNHEKNGVYSVQSGYCLSLHHQNTSFGEYAGIVYLRGCASIIVVLTVHITVFCVIQVQRTAFTYFSIAQIRQHMGLWS